MKYNFYRISNASKYLPLFSDSPHFRFVIKCNDYGNASTNVFSNICSVISNNRNFIVHDTPIYVFASKEQTETHSMPPILTISINDRFLFGFPCKIVQIVHYFYLKNNCNFYYWFYYCSILSISRIY